MTSALRYCFHLMFGIAFGEWLLKLPFLSRFLLQDNCQKELKIALSQARLRLTCQQPHRKEAIFFGG